MHQLILLALFAASTLAAPSHLLPRGGPCTTPGIYTCAPDASTMEVCDLDRHLKALVPGCPPGTVCRPNPFGNSIPYCMPKVTTKKRSEPGKRNETSGDDSPATTRIPPAATTTSADAEAGATGEASGEVATTRSRGPAATRTAKGAVGSTDAPPPPPPKATGGVAYTGGSCALLNKFSCFDDHGKWGIQICDLQGQLRVVGYCAGDEHCGNISGIPYCLASWSSYF